MTRLVVLWTAPRSLSSAVYQSMTTLQSTRIKCFFELYMYPCFFGSQCSRRPTRKLPIDPTYSAVNQALLQDYPGVDVVFAKELSKCLPAKDSPQHEQLLKELANAKHTFLIRDPAQVVYSRYKYQKKSTGYLTQSESNAGLMELYDLYHYVKTNFDQHPTVIDASDLQDNPSETMKLYCDAIEIPFEPHMIKWEAGKVDIQMPVDDWDNHFDTLNSSSGFITVPYAEQTTVPLDELTADMVEYIEKCRPHYEALRAKCIRPQSTKHV